MNVFAFGLTVSSDPLPDRDFFGSPLVLVEHRDLAVFGVESHGPPARTDEVLVAFDDIVRVVADQRPVLPHRFGVVSAADAIRAELEHHHDLLVDALDRVRDRDEWTVRLRPRVDDVLRSLPETTTEQLRQHGTALETGGAVHQLLVESASTGADALVDRCRDRDWPAVERVHDDALGADVVTLANRSDDVRSDVEQMTGELRRLADVELIGPGPAYRFAAQVTARMLPDTPPTAEGARR